MVSPQRASEKTWSPQKGTGGKRLHARRRKQPELQEMVSAQPGRARRSPNQRPAQRLPELRKCTYLSICLLFSLTADLSLQSDSQFWSSQTTSVLALCLLFVLAESIAGLATPRITSMSDAFADLWNSTGVAKPAEPPRKLGAMAATTQPMQARRPQNDVFSMLAATGPSSSTASRSTTPAQSPATGSNAPRPMQKATSGGPSRAMGGGDAFSGLLSGTFSSAQSNGANLTMAQRAALAEKERLERAQKTHSQPHAAQASSAWAGLDALGGSSIATSTKASSPSHDPLDDLGFGSFSHAPAPARQASKSPQPASALDDDWGFGDFSSQLASSTKAAPASDLLGLDDFAPASSSRQSSSPAPRSNTPGDFDFGDREDGLLGNQSDEDDILGDLGKPVEQLAAVSVNLSSRPRMCQRPGTEAFNPQHPFPSTAAIRTAVACGLTTTTCARPDRRDGLLNTAGEGRPCSDGHRPRRAGCAGDAPLQRRRRVVSIS